jgi:cell division septation protein DedD
VKPTRIIALATLCIAILTGCDAIRSALGKPTSKDIAALRQQKAQMQRTGDSLAVEMGALPDSLMADDAEPVAVAGDTAAVAFASVPEEVTPEENQPQDDSDQESQPEEEPTAGLADGYYVVLGSFKNADNAQYYYNSLSASGAEVHLVKMKNGFTAVMICHGSTYEEAYGKMLDFYSDKKRPEDIWIYNTAKNLHIE